MTLQNFTAAPLTRPDRPKPKPSSRNAKKVTVELLSNCYNSFLGMAWDRSTRLPSAVLKVLHMKSRITVKLIVSWNNMATNDFSLFLRLPVLCHLANLWEDMNICFSKSQTALSLQSYINKWITWNPWLTYKSHPAYSSFHFPFWQFKFRRHQSVARLDLCCWNIYLEAKC